LNYYAILLAKAIMTTLACFVWLNFFIHRLSVFNLPPQISWQYLCPCCGVNIKNSKQNSSRSKKRKML